MIGLLLAWCLAQERVTSDARCMECHSKEAALWKTSVHARHETGCISCHKSDEVNPDAKDKEKKHFQRKPFLSGMMNTSPAICATCHGQETAKFKESAHGSDEDVDPKAKWSAKKLQGCLTCHEPHGTAGASRSAIFAERCSHCHKGNSSQQKKMLSFIAAADPFDAELAALKKYLEHPLPGVPYAKAEAARDAAVETYREMRVSQHNCKFKELEEKIQPAFPALRAAHAPLKEQSESASRSRRKYFFGFLGLMAVNLLLLRAWCVKKYGGESHKA